MSLAAAAASVLVGSSNLFAVAINVPNNSFEADNAIHTNAAVSNWTFECDGASGTNDRDTNSFPLSNGALPGGSGSYIGFFNLPATNSAAQAYTQDFLHNSDSSALIVQPNTNYTMTVALGNVANFAANYNTPGRYRLQILTNFHEIIGSFEVDPTPGTGTGGGILDGQLKDYSFTYTSPAVATGVDAFGNAIPDLNNLYDGGHVILLQIQSIATGNDQQSSFDNVRFDATPAPEPVGLAMAGIGGAMALLKRRRQTA